MPCFHIGCRIWKKNPETLWEIIMIWHSFTNAKLSTARSAWRLVAVIVCHTPMRKRAIDKHVWVCDNVVISILPSEIIPDDCMSTKTKHQHATLNKILYLIPQNIHLKTKFHWKEVSSTQDDTLRDMHCKYYRQAIILYVWFDKKNTWSCMCIS